MITLKFTLLYVHSTLLHSSIIPTLLLLQFLNAVGLTTGAGLFTVLTASSRDSTHALTHAFSRVDAELRALTPLGYKRRGRELEEWLDGEGAYVRAVRHSWKSQWNSLVHDLSQHLL